MPRQLAGRRSIVLFGLAALFVSSACLGLTPVAPASTLQPVAGTSAAAIGTPVPAGSTPSVPANTPAPVGTPAPAGTPASPGAPTPVATALAIEGTVVFGAGAFNLIDPVVGLADLSSYTATLKLTFSGTQAGKPSQWTTTYVLLSAQPPAARQLTIVTAGDQSQPDLAFLAEAAGLAYERRGTDACTAAVLDPANSLLHKMEPAGFLASVIGAQAAGSETVNAAAATHYTFDEHALGQAGIAAATGEMWLAASGGYVVKYVLTTKGDAHTFGPDTIGTLTADYELTGVNQPVSVQLPADCPGGLVTAPQPPDAAHVESVPGFLFYDTAATLADAVSFYQQRLPGLGWTQSSDPFKSDTSVTLIYTQPGQNLTIYLAAGPAGTTVSLVLERVTP